MGQGAGLIGDGTRAIARPTGRLDADGADAFVAGIGDAGQSITVDLAAVEHLTLGAVRSFLRLGRILKDAGRTLDFANGSDPVRHAFEAAGFAHLFAFTPPLYPHRGHHHDDTP
jgi:anti-anti-sigma regulatory factor